MIVLRRVLDFLLLGAIILQFWKLYRYLIYPQCDNPSWSEELLLLRVIEGVLKAWLMYAFGLMDEMLRVFLGIRLTQGVGSPTSVDKVYSRISRLGEIVVEGIAVDDFPSLMGLYASSNGAALIKRGNTNGRRPNPVSTTHANANKSLMRIDRIAATAHMWSVTPWSPVRRYKRVHVKGITLRLVQVKGILNFTFLSLDKKRPPRSEQEANCKNANDRQCLNHSKDDSSKWESSSGCKMEAVDNGCSAPSQGLGMDDPDNVDADSEGEEHVEEALAKNNQGEEEAAEAAAPVDKRRRMSGTSMEAAIMRSLSSARPANGSRKNPPPSTTLEKGAGMGNIVDQQLNHKGCSCSAVGSEDGGSSVGAGSSRRGDSNVAGRTTNARVSRSMSVFVQQPAAEPVGNLGVMKDLGEAFMQRFDSYCRQVSSSLARMGEIKLIPNLWPSIAKWRRSGAPKNKKKRYEVGEIFLEDMCICVDAGVWSDLLGDHLGEVFSPEFRLEVKIGPQELLTPNGEGRPLSEIGGLVSEKLVRLLARLVMRETVKTSTLMSLVVTSLALDTDARGRRQKNLASPPTMEQEAGKVYHEGNDCSINRGSGSGGGRRRTLPSTFGVAGLESRSQSLSDCRPRRSSDRSSHTDGIVSSRTGSFILSDGEGGSIFGGSSSVGSCRDGWGGRWMLKTRKSSHAGFKPAASWRRPSESGPRVQRIRPWMQQNERPRRRPLSRGRKPHQPNDEGDSDDAGIARKSWLKFGMKDHTGRRGSSSGLCEISKKEVIESSPKVVDNREGALQHLETVAMAPPWMEEVEASADYECLKPALDVVKRTVLLAVLKETNRYADVRMNSSFTEKEAMEKQNGWSWGRRQRDTWKMDVSMELKRSMEEELIAAKNAGSDVDRLIMTQLLAQVRETGPTNAFKALASIELSPLIQDLAAETRLSQRLENIGIDMSHVAQSLSGLTAGEVMEGFKTIVGRVGGEARRLKAEAIRVQQELLDETGILPLLNKAAGGKEVTSLVSSLSDILIGAGAGADGGVGSTNPFPGSMKNKGSWERGVAVSKYPTEANRRVEKGLGLRGGVKLEEIDEVDVVLQVLDLLEAVESLRVSIMNGDGVTLNNLEHAFGKVAGKIDVYLVLAAIESVLGLLLESLGKLPVGQSKFAGKGVECRVWNLDLKGLHVSRKNVDLVMKGFRLPKRGAAVKTPFGPGKIKRYKKRSRCFVVNLDWTMGNGKSVKAYMQPADIVVLEGHEGRLSEEEEEEVIGRRGNGRVIADNREATSGRFSDEYAGGKSWRETHKVPPPGDAGAQPIDADKSRWLSRLWSRRKSSGIAGISEDSQLPERKVEAMSLVGSDVGVSYRYETRDEDGTLMVRRCASAPSLISPPRKKPQNKSKPVRKWVCRLPQSPVSTVEGPKGLVVRSEDPVVSRDGVQNVAGRDSPFSDATSTTDACSMRRGGSQSSSQAAAFNEETLDDRTRRIMAGSTSVTEMTPAPFLVARISGVVVELKDVMWSVKQTAFPRLETAGSLQATVSGLSIELELDSDMQEEEGPVLESDGDVVGGGRYKSLRLTRLRVSAMGIKIHVNNSALSTVFNLAASAFEAALKRHVVENVEDVVRKNLTSLLAIMNESEKLRVLFRGDGNGMRLKHVGTVFEKVMERSRSHHVVWAAGRGNVDKASIVSRSGSVLGGRERGRGQSSRKIGVRSGPSKDNKGTEPTGAGKILVKRLFRGKLARPVDRKQSMDRRRRPVASIKSGKKEGYKKWLRGRAVRSRRDVSGESQRAPGSNDFIP